MLAGDSVLAGGPVLAGGTVLLEPFGTAHGPGGGAPALQLLEDLVPILVAVGIGHGTRYGGSVGRTLVTLRA